MTAGLDGPLVAACVGSSCPSRRWFPERTAAVLRELRARHGASAVLLGAAADAPFALETLRATDGGVRDLVGRTTLRQLLAILARARLAFGPDSGALHLAAALGTPAVSLWGATSALRSTPFGCERLTVVGRAPCAPCFLRDCPIERVCMRDIATDAVVARAARCWRNERRRRRSGWPWWLRRTIRGCERRARSSLLRRAFRHASSVVAALAALAPRLVRSLIMATRTDSLSPGRRRGGAAGSTRRRGSIRPPAWRPRPEASDARRDTRALSRSPRPAARSS